MAAASASRPAAPSASRPSGGISKRVPPQPESLAYEGLFYNYYFDTGGDGSCDSLFCPSYSPAVTADPSPARRARYLTVGLNSGLEASEFERKRLNLVVVLDISGSMSSPFSEYYYDQHGNRHEPDGDTERPKIEVARDALVALTEQLREGDRLGVVLYSSESAVAKPLRPVEATDMNAIRDHIQENVRAGGGPISTPASPTRRSYCRRTKTPTSPRTRTGWSSSPTRCRTWATRTTRTCVRNSRPTLSATSTPRSSASASTSTPTSWTNSPPSAGANYYAVHSADEFERTLGEEFEYMVTPLAFDVSLELEAEGYDIEQVYGSTAAEDATDELLGVNTLFASPTEDGKTRGGVVLVQVERQSEDATMRLSASWEDRQGTRSETETTISFPDGEPEQFANTGVRKAVLLSRYADLPEELDGGRAHGRRSGRSGGRRGRQGRPLGSQFHPKERG